MTNTAEAIIDLLKLQPHPEGGCFREMFRDPREHDGRSVSTAIYYLLRHGEISRWHRVDAAEVWHFYAGSPLELSLSSKEGQVNRQVLGIDLAAGERPQMVIPAGCWQMAQSFGDWTLVGCTVAPGFEFAGFEMAPQGWEP
ncbi:MAG: cupin domain-containing protein [Novosphingobium sp.]|nr:cupin domain-containing protein [Novosphingobium sp.]